MSWIDFQGGVPVLGPQVALPPSGPGSISLFAAVDVDGDGIDDLAATGPVSTAPNTVLFLPTVAGTPTVDGSFPIPASMQNVNQRIHAGDLDGDGDRDLLLFKMFTSDPGPWVQVFERIPTGWIQHAEQSVPCPTTGWFQPQITYLTDWNGDGWLDVAAAGSTFEVLRSNGNWTFSEGFESPSVGQGAGGGCFDLDGDGFADLVAAHSVLYGTSQFVPPATEPFVSLQKPIVADRDGDGDVDVTNATGAQYAANDATGAMTLFNRFAPSVAPNTVGESVAYADFDGNGRPEVLVPLFVPTPIPTPPIRLEMLRFEEYGENGFLPPVAATNVGDHIPALPFGDSTVWSTGDVDGDGDLDLLLDGGYRVNDGTGRLDVFVSMLGRGRMAADVNGDGRPDVLATRTTGGNAEVWVHFGGPSGFVSTLVTTMPGSVNATWRDLDGDGDLDVIAAAPNAKGMRLFENLGTSFVAGAAQFPDTVLASMDLVGIGDFDGDGIRDLWVQNEHTGSLTTFRTLAMYRGTGAGLGYTLVIEHLAPWTLTGMADVDSDGDLDAFGGVLVRNQHVPTLEGGAIQQFGHGLAGTGGFVPLVGATGPVRSNNPRDELRVKRGLGGTFAFLTLGVVQTALPGPLPGMELYIGDPLLLGVPLSGSPGAPGEGEFVLTLPDLGGVMGLRILFQVFAVDPGTPDGWSSSNACAITFGL